LDRIDIQSAIDVLPKGYKNAFVLHDIHGYDHREIAEMAGNSVGSSKSQLHKARLRLRKLLSAKHTKSARKAQFSSRLTESEKFGNQTLDAQPSL